MNIWQVNIDPGTVVLGGAMNFGGHGSTVGGKFLDRVRDHHYQLGHIDPLCELCSPDPQILKGVVSRILFGGSK